MTFLRAVLGQLEPRALAKASDFMASGDFAEALNEYSLLAAAQPEKASLRFRAGLAALGAGDTAEAERWFDEAIETAVSAPNAGQLLSQALSNLDNFLADNPNVDGRAIREKLEAAQVAAQATNPAVSFADGLAALADGSLTEAEALYKRGLELSADRRYFVPLKTAVFELLAYPEQEAEPVFELVREELEDLTAVATAESDVAAAFELAYIAVVVEDWPTAGAWYNEAIRRTVVNNQYPTLRATREDFYQLWGITGVTSNRILAAMEDALPDQLAAHPDLNENQLYWRFRAWFKYGVGLSAYRLDEETAAAAALRSGQPDADIAYALDAGGNAYVKSYLTEGAWGWYNVIRGDDAYKVGEYEEARGFYELAAQAYRPDRNNDAKAEAILAALRASFASVYLEEFDQAASWLGEGLRLIELYDRPEDIALARNELVQLAADLPELAAEIEDLLALLPE
jgi:tetratricopeptide (TPR) repeat protein